MTIYADGDAMMIQNPEVKPEQLANKKTFKNVKTNPIHHKPMMKTAKRNGSSTR